MTNPWSNIGSVHKEVTFTDPATCASVVATMLVRARKLNVAEALMVAKFPVGEEPPEWLPAPKEPGRLLPETATNKACNVYVFDLGDLLLDLFEDTSLRLRIVQDPAPEDAEIEP